MIVMQYIDESKALVVYANQNTFKFKLKRIYEMLNAGLLRYFNAQKKYLTAFLLLHLFFFACGSAVCFSDYNVASIISQCFVSERISVFYIIILVFAALTGITVFGKAVSTFIFALNSFVSSTSITFYLKNGFFNDRFSFFAVSCLLSLYFFVSTLFLVDVFRFRSLARSAEISKGNAKLIFFYSLKAVVFIVFLQFISLFLFDFLR